MQKLGPSKHKESNSEGAFSVRSRHRNFSVLATGQRIVSGSHAGLVTIRFYMKPYEYEVGEGMGMTSGIRLSVYKDRRRIAYFDSHTEKSQMVNINFDRPSSPTFKLVNPIESW